LRERRHAASRAPSVRSDLGVGFLSVARVCPTAIPTRTRHLRRLAPERSVVTIDVHGSVDRVKDVIFSIASGSRPRSRVHALGLAHADAVPLLGHHRTPFVPGASVGMGGSPYRLSTTGLGPCSDDAPRRAPPSPGPGCLSPSPISPRRLERDCSRLLVRVGLPLTPPPLFPQAGESVEWGLASTTERSPVSASVVFWTSGVRTPFLPAGLPVPGTDDPSAPTWPGRRGRSRSWLLRSEPTPAAAP
jgi:hypothetical protein